MCNGVDGNISEFSLQIRVRLYASPLAFEICLQTNANVNLKHSTSHRHYSLKKSTNYKFFVHCFRSNLNIIVIVCSLWFNSLISQQQHYSSYCQISICIRQITNFVKINWSLPNRLKFFFILTGPNLLNFN